MNQFTFARMTVRIVSIVALVLLGSMALDYEVVGNGLEPTMAGLVAILVLVTWNHTIVWLHQAELEELYSLIEKEHEMNM